MTTVHAATATVTQKTVDGPNNKDWIGGRGILTCRRSIKRGN